MTGLPTTCPLCKHDTTIWVDTSCGVPSEAASHCKNCEQILEYRVDWEPNIWLGDFIRAYPDPVMENHKRTQSANETSD